MNLGRILRSNENVVHLKGVPDGKRIEGPSRAETRTLYLLIGGGVFTVSIFLYWLGTATTPGHLLLYTLLITTISFKLLRLLHEWYHYAAIKTAPLPAAKRDWEVDLLTTYCAGEPYEMVINTLRAMKAVRYPHKTFLCDEENDPYLKKICAELGVIHVYRGLDKTDAKAGNINYALRKHAKGEICVILDPDHVPRPDFLDRVLPWFEQEKVGFVQCVQAYSNQKNSLIAKGAAEHTYHFYGPMMMSMNSYGTVQAIGANCTFRRAALDSIGGHAQGLSEDMHTAMRLHAAGWKSIYVPENLSRGLVPETLSSFYKQQLKWARGSLDLLFHTFPTLARAFSWRQILHYLTLPLYFLTGLISAIDIFLPMLALAMGRVPIFADLTEMVQVVAPVLIFLALNRLFVQKWTLDRTEKGLHFWGGVLLLSTWWVYLVGFIYAIFRIKVPYIPTPKEGVLANEWKIVIPNMVVILLGIGSILFGLYQDWSPYSWFMSGLVLTNILMLGIGILISQRKLTHRIYQELLDGKWAGYRRKWASFRYDVIYQSFRSKQLAVILSLGIVLLYGMVWGDFFDANKSLAELRPSGASLLHTGQGFQWSLPATTKGMESPIIQRHIHLARFNGRVQDQPQEVLQKSQSVTNQGYTPFLSYSLTDDELTNEGLYKAITDSVFDDQIKALIFPLTREQIRTYIHLDIPVPKDRSLAIAYKKAWQHVVGISHAYDLTNLNWIWELPPDSPQVYFPGESWIDGFQLDVSGPHQAYHFFEKAYPISSRPLFLPFLHRDSLHTAPQIWQALHQGWDIASIGFGEVPKDLSSLAVYTQQQQLALAPVRSLYIPPPLENEIRSTKTALTSPKGTRLISHSSYDHSLWVAEKSFYVKGIAYNPGHDWRDGYYPLVRENLDRDFAQIKAMGANTIRRYSPSIYDRNILSAARRHELKVLYGFWFDPKIDYYANEEKVDSYIAETLERVRELKDDPTILGWSIGNETYGLIKQYSHSTYMPKIRYAYLTMLELLARKIHELDPTRPVFSMLEHSPELAHSLADFRQWAPSIDILGVNSYYRSRMSQVDSIMHTVYPGKPYILSEFGPGGYWDETLTHQDERGRILEQTDLQKARDYYQQWQKDIFPHKGHNLGGIAYCWRDRMEGSLSWFGLTDLKNRKKMGYYALKKAWTGTNPEVSLKDVRISIRPFYPQEYEFRVIIPHSWQDYDISWECRSDEFLYRKGKIVPTEDPRVVLVQTPEIPAAELGYRVYAYLDDRKGNVVTVSHPLTLPPNR